MDSKAILPQHTSKHGEDIEKSSRRHHYLTKPKLLAVIALVLGLAAIIGACAVAALALLPPRPGSGREGHVEGEVQQMVSMQARAKSSNE